MKNTGADQSFYASRAESFQHAFRGVAVLLRTQLNVRIHLGAFFLVMAMSAWLRISLVEWCLIVGAVGFVMVAEALNTALEFLSDAVSKEYHPAIRDAKDVAASAVLLAAIVAFTVGCILFLPKLFVLLIS